MARARFAFAVFALSFAGSLGAILPSVPVARAEVPLIAREKLFGNPDRAQGKISPDGKYLSWLAPVDGVLNVWVAPVATPDKAVPVTKDKLRGIRSYAWAFDGAHLLYQQDRGGNENFHLYAVLLYKQELIYGP